ncbi:MAG: aspartyl/asparaginyl beta-hydroxylase domain-containing protein [Gammaproteobacteria bacterium]|nr:aspartyl/asparaginyl beta-hydroxylase domain-containing protein [Gammaproteobacteria bacterium]
MSDLKEELKSAISARRQKLTPDKQRLLKERLDGQFSRSFSQRLLAEIDDKINVARLQYGKIALERLEQSIAIFKGGAKSSDADPRQVADALYFPGLSAKPWHEPEDFDWVPKMEASAAVIRSELSNLFKKEAEFNPYQHPYTKEFGWKGWGTYSFYRVNKWDNEHCLSCPKTIESIRQTPHGLRECMFTRLLPDSHITPHSGGSNIVLTCHLGLHIPEGCAIRVENETRTWEEGKCLIFDDSYMHEVWHRGQGIRTVLLWDIWHPDLTEIEKSVLTMIFPIIDKYLEHAAKV